MTKKEYELNYANFLINSAKIIADGLDQHLEMSEGADKSFLDKPVIKAEEIVEQEVIQQPIQYEQPKDYTNLILYIGLGLLIYSMLRRTK